MYALTSLDQNPTEILIDVCCSSLVIHNKLGLIVNTCYNFIEQNLCAIVTAAINLFTYSLNLIECGLRFFFIRWSSLYSVRVTQTG